MQRLNLYTEVGGVTVVTGGNSSTTKVMGVFPGATVTVFNSGTVVPSSIFGDNLGSPTPKTNPFTSDSNTGLGFFYATNGRYDVQISGVGFSTFTLGDIELTDPADPTTIGTLTVTGNATVGGTLGVTGLSTLAALTATGNVTEIAGQNQLKAYSINSVLWVDGIKYTTLAAAYADLPSGGGVVVVPPNYSETLAADITVKHDSGFLFMGPAAITMGAHQFKCAGGTADGFFINSMIPFGSAGSPSAGVVFAYTGTTTPFSLGDTTTDSFQLSLRNFAINISGAGAATVAITLNRWHTFTFENLRIIGVTGQIGIKLNGTGGYTGNGTLINMYTNGLTSAIQMFNEGNSNQIIGGTFANTAAGGKGIDILSGNGNLIFGGDIENATTGVNIASDANNFGNRCWIYGQGNTTDFVIGALATGNIVDNIGANGTTIITTVTDSGTNNSVTNPYKLKSDVNGLLTSGGGVTIASGKNVTAGRLISVGTVPTSVAVTGAGASGTASLIAGSTDSSGIIRIACAGAGPAATGTITLTLSTALGVAFVTGELIPSSAVTAWNGRATIFQTNYSNTTPVFSWDNNAVALVAGSSYDIVYRCVGQ